MDPCRLTLFETFPDFFIEYQINGRFLIVIICIDQMKDLYLIHYFFK
jgi:hypothetical protein